jgi:hypothetical protein
MIKPTYLDGPTEQGLKDILDNRILAKVRNTPIDLGVALGEYRETANFIASAMVKTVQAARAARRGDLSAMTQIIAGRHRGSNVIGKFGKTKSGIKLAESEHRMLEVIGRDTKRWQSVPLSAGGTLLAINYGLKPLLSDVEGAYNYLSDVYQPDSKSVFHFRTRFPEQALRLQADNGWFLSQYGRPAEAGCAYSFKISGNAYMAAVMDNPVLYHLDKLGLLNPISTGYELVPFSFVLDWFIPIGDLLRNVPDPKGINFLEGYRVVRLNGGWEEWTKIPSPAPGWNTFLEGSEWYKDRKKYTAFPRYSLRPAPLETYRRRIANGTALLSQFAFGEDPKVNEPTRKDFRLLEPLGIRRSEFRRLSKFR